MLIENIIFNFHAQIYKREFIVLNGGDFLKKYHLILTARFRLRSSFLRQFGHRSIFLRPGGQFRPSLSNPTALVLFQLRRHLWDTFQVNDALTLGSYASVDNASVVSVDNASVVSVDSASVAIIE